MIDSILSRLCQAECKLSTSVHQAGKNHYIISLLKILLTGKKILDNPCKRIDN
jgi:hypothetical protein